jgi:hypothetical protein
MLAIVNLAQIIAFRCSFMMQRLNTWGMGDSLRASAVFQCVALVYYRQRHVAQIICARVMR